MAKENNEVFRVKVTKEMCNNIYPVVKPGDIIHVNFKEKIFPGDLVFVSNNEKQWIEKYSEKLRKYNVYLISKVVIQS